MNRSLRLVAVALALAIVIVPAAVFAQQTESRIAGRVLDDSKAAMPGVTVEVTSKSTWLQYARRSRVRMEPIP